MNAEDAESAENTEEKQLKKIEGGCGRDIIPPRLPL